MLYESELLLFTLLLQNEINKFKAVKDYWMCGTV